MATTPIDLSAGLTPKSGAVDLSAGLVPSSGSFTAPPDLSNKQGQGTYQMAGPDGKAVGVPYGQVQQAAGSGYKFASDPEQFRFAKDNAADPQRTTQFTPAQGDPRANLDYQQQMEQKLPAPMQVVAGVAKAGGELASPVVSAIGAGVGASSADVDKMLTPQGGIQKAAKYGTMAASLVPAGADAVTAVRSLSPTMLKGNGAALLQSVAHDANKLPVQLQNTEQAALDLIDWQKKAQLGPTINKFLARITRPNEGPLTYEEGRDFYQLLGNLSADEKTRLAPVIKRDLTRLVIGLKADLGDTADQVGKAAEYYKGLGDYAKGAKLGEWLDAAKKYAVPAGLGAAGLAGANKLLSLYNNMTR